VSAERSRWSDGARFNAPSEGLRRLDPPPTALGLELAAAGAEGDAEAEAEAEAGDAVRCSGERTPERAACTLVGPLVGPLAAAAV